MNLADLGFTKEELQERVVEQCCRLVLEGTFADEEGGEFTDDSKFAKTLKERVKQQIDDTINALAEKHVLPNVSAYIENLTLQQTTKWGEKQGEPVTFIEYLTQRAEAYMQEQVNYEGKSKEECSSSGWSWKGTQTRLAHLIDKHLHYSIENAMKGALSIVTSNISKGIEETVRLKLSELSAQLKAEVKIK